MYLVSKHPTIMDLLHLYLNIFKCITFCKGDINSSTVICVVLDKIWQKKVWNSLQLHMFPLKELLADFPTYSRKKEIEMMGFDF